MTSCKCKVCTRSRRLATLTGSIESPSDQEFLKGIHSDLLNAEFDVDISERRSENMRKRIKELSESNSKALDIQVTTHSAGTRGWG